MRVFLGKDSWRLSLKIIKSMLEKELKNVPL